jgi:hypothetical protein
VSSRQETEQAFASFAVSSEYRFFIDCLRLTPRFSEQSNLNPDGSQHSLRIYEVHPGLVAPQFNCTKTIILSHDYKTIAVSMEYIAFTLDDGTSKTLHVYNVSQHPSSSPAWTRCEWATTKELDSVSRNKSRRYCVLYLIPRVASYLWNDHRRRRRCWCSRF